MKLYEDFICATKEYAEFDSFVPAPLFRRDFTVKDGLKQAEITVSAVGFYEIYVNGIKITKGALAPYISNPDDIVYYDSYDISKYLVAGKNTLAFILGNGFANGVGGDVWDFDKAPFRSSPKLSFCAELLYKDGKKEEIVSDGDVLCHPSAIIFDDLRAGEFYDARAYIKGWNLPSFTPDSTWYRALRADAPKGKKELCRADPIITVGEYAPVSVRPGKIARPQRRNQSHYSPETPDDEKFTEGYLYTFEKNYAGNCRIRIHGYRGQKVILQYGDTLYGDGLDLNDATFLPERFDWRDIIICSGGDDVYTPHFTYHGFQYVLVGGITEEQAVPSLLTYVAMHSDIRKKASFTCSDGISNRIVSAALNSDESNFFYFPTDCPHREKNGWTGDASLSAEQYLTYYDCAKSLSVWLDNIRLAQKDDGSLPGIIPTGGWGFSWGNGPGFDRVIFELPYQIYRFTGNKKIITDNLPAMIKYLKYTETKRDSFGLIHYGLGDWVQTSATNYEKEALAPLGLVCTILARDMCAKTEALASAVGENALADYARALGASYLDSSRAHLIDFDTMTAAGECQTSQAMAIFYNIFTPDETPAAFDRLLRIISRDGNKFLVGIHGMRTLFRVLASHGQADLALDMITGPSYPSYGFWTEQGATTLWETFLPTGEKRHSHNHHFFGDVISWYMTYCAGIHINEDLTSPDSVTVSPVFPARLNDISASVALTRGTLSVSWHRLGSSILLKLTVPDGASGRIVLPSPFRFSDTSAQKPMLTGEYVIYS